MGKFNGFNSSEKTWNMDQLFTERIDRRLDQLDLASVESNQIVRYRILYNIFIGTHFKYEKNKIINLKKDFKEVKTILNSSSANISKIGKMQHQSLIISVVEEKLDDLHFEIMSLLYESDLICLKKKKWLSPEEEVENDY